MKPSLRRPPPGPQRKVPPTEPPFRVHCRCKFTIDQSSAGAVSFETPARFRLRMPSLRGFRSTVDEIFEEVLRPLLFELGLLFGYRGQALALVWALPVRGTMVFSLDTVSRELCLWRHAWLFDNRSCGRSPGGELAPESGRYSPCPHWRCAWARQATKRRALDELNNYMHFFINRPL